MPVKVITPPAQAISTAELRLQSRADTDSTSEDVLFVGWIAAAVNLAQHQTGRSIGVQTLELALDSFPVCWIDLLNGPVSSITSIKYIDVAGVEQTLSPATYTLNDYGLIHAAVLKPGNSWPAVDGSVNGVKVRYIAGNLDPAVKVALFLIVANWYAHREASTPVNLNEIPMGAQALLDTVKIWAV